MRLRQGRAAAENSNEINDLYHLRIAVHRKDWIMQELAMREKYKADLASQIEAMGSLAVAVANRWIMGWPQRVGALMKAGTYLESLGPDISRSW
jgi:hypothetical protein